MKIEKRVIEKIWVDASLGEMERELDYFSKKYLDKDIVYYLQEARALISDLQYAEETMKRTRQNTRFDIHAIPGMSRTITDWFLRHLFGTNCHQLYHCEREDRYIIYLKIYDITDVLMSSMFSNVGLSLEQLGEVKRWQPVLLWYTGLDIVDHFGSFHGSHRQLEIIKEHWRELESADAENP